MQSCFCRIPHGGVSRGVHQVPLRSRVLLRIKKAQIGLLRDFVFVWSFYHGTFAAPPNVSAVFGQLREGEQRAADVLMPVVDHTLWAGQQPVERLPSSEMVYDLEEMQVGLQIILQNSINVSRITRPDISHNSRER